MNPVMPDTMARLWRTVRLLRQAAANHVRRNAAQELPRIQLKTGMRIL
jgi:hypothetical protein